MYLCPWIMFIFLGTIYPLCLSSDTRQHVKLAASLHPACHTPFLGCPTPFPCSWSPSSKESQGQVCLTALLLLFTVASMWQRWETTSPYYLLLPILLLPQPGAEVHSGRIQILNSPKNWGHTWSSGFVLGFALPLQGFAFHPLALAGSGSPLLLWSCFLRFAHWDTQGNWVTMLTSWLGKEKRDGAN